MSLLENATLSAPGESYYALAGSQVPIPGPPGATGAQGPPGIQGPPGNSILSDVVPPTPAVGNVSDLFVDLVTSQLYKKTDAVTWTPEFGLIGAAGTPATAAVGLTVTVAAGQPANVTNTGPNPSNAIFNFAIPQGIQGATGPPGSSSEATWSNYPAISAVDIGNFPIQNAASITAPVGLSIYAGAGDLTLNVTNPATSVVIKGGALDVDANDLKNVGSISTSGAANTVDFGSVLPPDAPLARFSVLSSEVTLNHINPLTQMLLKGLGDVRVESTNGDLNLIGDDVNIATTGATNALNITAAGAVQITSGGAINNSVGGGYGIQAGALISITTPGQINIGSGNVLGATTSIEKVDFLDSVISKIPAPGTADLQIQNVLKISNAGGGTNTLTVEATNAFLTLQGTQTNLTSLSNGNVIIAPQGTGTTRVGTGTAADVVVVDATGKTTFSVVPATAAPPVAGPDLVNKTYADTKIAGDQNVSLLYSLATTAVNTATSGPFFYVPAAAGPPTGLPVVIPGSVPLYMDITGGAADLYAYVSGAWVPV
jgi:hypothetical protein